MKDEQSICSIVLSAGRLVGIVALDGAAQAKIAWDGLSDVGRRARKLAHGTPALLWLDVPLDGTGANDFKTLLKAKLRARRLKSARHGRTRRPILAGRARNFPAAGARRVWLHVRRALARRDLASPCRRSRRRGARDACRAARSRRDLQASVRAAARHERVSRPAPPVASPAGRARRARSTSCSRPSPPAAKATACPRGSRRCFAATTTRSARRSRSFAATRRPS